jgi:hypothetical protein
MNNKTESRLASPDILKVISITAVVFIHGSSLIPLSPSDSGGTVYIFNLNLMFRFCVPIFIFLWAYFQEKSTLKHGSTTLLRSRFYTLFIPFFFWSLVYFVITANFKALTLTKILTIHWTGFGWSGQYYFVILFQLILLFPIIRWISLKVARFLPMVYITSLIMYGLISYTGWLYLDAVGKIGDRPFIYWLPYAILGVIYAHKNIFHVKVPLLLGLISAGLIALEFHIFNLREVGIYLHLAVFITSFILLSFLEYRISYASLSRPVAWVIQIVAKNTLGIFCLNPLVIIVASAFFHSYGIALNFEGAAILAPILSIIFIIIACMLVTTLLKRIRLGILIAN